MTTPKLKEIRWKNRCLSVETSISIIFHTRNWCWRERRAIFKACLLFGALQGISGDASVARHCPCNHINDCVGLGLRRTFRIWHSVLWADFKSRPESDSDKFEWGWPIGQLHKQVTIQTTTQTWLNKSQNFEKKSSTIIKLRQAIKRNWNDFDYDEPITTIQKKTSFTRWKQSEYKSMAITIEFEEFISICSSSSRDESIVVSLFVYNLVEIDKYWFSVSDNKIQMSILILRRGAMSSYE